MFLETVDSLPDASEESRTLVTTIRQILGSQEKGDEDLVIEAEGQYVIVTDAQRPIFGVSLKNMKANRRIRVEVSTIEEEKIKDTIGAGDSFIAGFLYSVAFAEEGQAKSLRSAINNGISIAQSIIQEVGVTMPVERLE